MTGPRTIVGLCGLCLLVTGALAAPAFASLPGGTTAFTCKAKPAGGAGFSHAHCKAADAVASGATYEDVPIAEGTSTATEVSSKDTAGANQTTEIKGTLIGPVSVEIQATESSGLGSSKNSESATAEHFVRGEAVITYNHVTVVEPAGCKVKGEKIVTNNLKATTAGQIGAIKVQPAGGVFATFEVESCSNPIFNGTHAFTGSIACPIDGSTITCAHAATTAQATLLLDGEPIGIEGSSTAKGKDTALGDPTYTSLSTTAAAAPTSGATAFTCKNQGPGHTFANPHCTPTVPSGGEYEHVSVAEGTDTGLELVNKDAAGKFQTAKIKTVIAGIALELQAAKVTGTGMVKNSRSAIGEHFAHGEATLSYSEVTVATPAGKGCKVKEGKFNTEPLMRGEVGLTERLEPASGERFARVVIEGCSLGTLNGTWEILGSVICPVEGATTTCSHATTTEQGDLKINGQKVGIESVLTASGGTTAGGYAPLSLTAVGTP